jgi:DNA-binding MarR family transcriptional regulator
MKLGDALGLIHNFREYSDMPMSQAYCLLLIARYEGLSLKELAHRADIGMASASRYVATFGTQGYKGEKGLGLVEALEDPMERRKKIIKLTQKGKMTVNKLIGDKNADL